MEDIPLFLELFKQRLLDTSLQNWHSDVMDNRKLETYSTYKIDFCLETYLTIDMYHKHRIEYTRFRCSSHNLAIEKLRPTHDRVDRVCKYCRHHGITVIEDEHHFLLQCPLYINERSIYIQKYLTYHNDAVFTYLLSSNCHSVVKNVATYIYHANHRRTEYNSANM